MTDPVDPNGSYKDRRKSFHQMLYSQPSSTNGSTVGSRTQSPNPPPYVPNMAPQSSAPSAYNDDDTPTSSLAAVTYSDDTLLRRTAKGAKSVHYVLPSEAPSSSKQRHGKPFKPDFSLRRTQSHKSYIPPHSHTHAVQPSPNRRRVFLRDGDGDDIDDEQLLHEMMPDSEPDAATEHDLSTYTATNHRSNGYASEGTALSRAGLLPATNGVANGKRAITHKRRVKSHKRVASQKPHMVSNARRRDSKTDTLLTMSVAYKTVSLDSANDADADADAEDEIVRSVPSLEHTLQKSVERFRPKRIDTEAIDKQIDNQLIKENITASIDRFKRKKHPNGKDSASLKRWSVSDTNSMHQLKTRFGNASKSDASDKKAKLGVGGKLGARRRSIFNQKHAMTPMEPSDNTAYETINSQKWDIPKLMAVETEREFHATLASHSKQDIIELCWDLLRSKDKSDDLLRMVSLMNTDLNPEKAYETMMSTIAETLDCKFCSLYAIEEESFFLKCLWTSEGEPEKEIFVSITDSNLLPAQVFQGNDAVTRSLTSHTEQVCPDYDGFYVYVMGVPIRDHLHGDKLGVLMMYRDRSRTDMFDDRDLHSAQMLCNIAASTLKNVSLYNAANEKERRSRQILGIIDEMSGDVSAGYETVLKKIMRKVRSLVTCADIDLWRVDFERGTLRCEISHNVQHLNTVIACSNEHLIGQCALSGVVIKIDNSRMDPRYTAESLAHCRGDSILVVPVRAEGAEPIAVIVAVNKFMKKKNGKQTIPFANEDRRILETFASSAQITIGNSLLLQTVIGLNRKHESMVSILRALQEKHNVTHMLSEATMAVRDALEAERVSLWFEDGQGNLDALDIGDVSGGYFDDDDEKDFNNDPAVQTIFSAIARHCAEDRVLINTPNIIEDAAIWNAIHELIEYEQVSTLTENHWFFKRQISVLCVPIVSNESVVGVLQAIYKKGFFCFTEADQQIVEAVCSEIAHTIARNISDLTLQKYVNKHDDIPLDVIEYYLTGSLDQKPKPEPQTLQAPANNQQQPQIPFTPLIVPNSSDADGAVVLLQPNGDVKMNPYTKIFLDERLRAYSEILPTCDFDATQFTEPSDLEQFVLFALDESGLIQEFHLHQAKLSKFVHAVAKLYRTNPFHNWQHGFFVFHFALYFMHKQGAITQLLSKRHILAVLVAALCHDIDHPGNDNLFEIEADTDLARIYNGLSVLENHHAYTTQALLRKPELNFFEGSTLEKKDVRDMKQIITKSIMSTDMSHHFEAIGWLNDFVNQRAVQETLRDPKVSDKKKDEVKLKICQCLVHLGDLSAQTYPWRIAKEWEKRIATEFKQQTIKETKLELPVREFMTKTDLQTRYKGQWAFVTHVVKPLWEPAAALFPEMEERLETLKANSQKYIEIANKKGNSSQK